MIKKTKEVKKDKPRRSKMEKEQLKNFVFEKLAYWYSQKEISDLTWYSVQHICSLNKEIEEEFKDQIEEKDRNKLITKEIRRLEGITKKLYKSLDWENNPHRIVALHSQILKTLEFKTKLQWLMIERVENKVSVNEILTTEEEQEFNNLFDE